MINLIQIDAILSCRLPYGVPVIACDRLVYRKDLATDFAKLFKICSYEFAHSQVLCNLQLRKPGRGVSASSPRATNFSKTSNAIAMDNCHLNTTLLLNSYQPSLTKSCACSLLSFTYTLFHNDGDHLCPIPSMSPALFSSQWGRGHSLWNRFPISCTQ